MKKLAIIFITTAFFAHSSFAETTGTAAANEFDIASGASGTASVSAQAPQQSTPIDKNMAIVTITKHEEDAKLAYAIDVNYPQITGENLSPAAQKFNQLVTDKVNQNIQQFKNYVKADMPHMQTLPDSVKHNHFRMDYHVDILKPANQFLLSLRLSMEGMQAGRAHPYHTHDVLNFDLKKGTVLILKDLFKPRVNYLNVLSKYCEQKLNEKLQEKWMIKEGAAPLAKNYPLWNLNKTGILITFEEYQVAPYYEGAQEVEVPYSALKKFLALNSVVR